MVDDVLLSTTARMLSLALNRLDGSPCTTRKRGEGQFVRFAKMEKTVII
jgi:hypothetical protein